MSVGNPLKCNENISGEDNPWRTGVDCTSTGCMGQLLCWVELGSTRPVFYYKCPECEVNGTWYQLAMRRPR